MSLFIWKHPPTSCNIHQKSRNSSIRDIQRTQCMRSSLDFMLKYVSVRNFSLYYFHDELKVCTFVSIQLHCMVYHAYDIHKTVFH